MGAFLGSIFVKYVIDDFASLGMTLGNYYYPIGFIFGAEVLVTFLLMVVILVVVHKKSLNKFSGVAIGGIIGLVVIFFREMSGASMNPVHSLAPAIIEGIPNELWIFWVIPIPGSLIAGLIYREKFHLILNKQPQIRSKYYE